MAIRIPEVVFTTYKSNEEKSSGGQGGGDMQLGLLVDAKGSTSTSKTKTWQKAGGLLIVVSVMSVSKFERYFFSLSRRYLSCWLH